MGGQGIVMKRFDMYNFYKNKLSVKKTWWAHKNSEKSFKEEAVVNHVQCGWGVEENEGEELTKMESLAIFTRVISEGDEDWQLNWSGVD